MKINTDINILGGLPDWNLIFVFLDEKYNTGEKNASHHQYTAIKTHKAVTRFKKAINSSILNFKNPKVESLVKSMLRSGSLTVDNILMLFWNASYNNNLLDYLNRSVYFPALYSGRISLRKEEVMACLTELKENQVQLKDWSLKTIDITASKYLTLLKKFHLLEGTQKKTLLHPHVTDIMFVMFVYWQQTIEQKSNILSSAWLQYSFLETNLFTERALQKKYSKFFNVSYTGDRLSIELLVPFENIYDVIKES